MAGVEPLPWLVISKMPLSAEKGLNLDILDWQKWCGIVGLVACGVVFMRIITLLNYCSNLKIETHIEPKFLGLWGKRMMSLSVLIGSQVLNAKVQPVNNALQYWMLQMSLIHCVTHGPLGTQMCSGCSLAGEGFDSKLFIIKCLFSAGAVQ